MAEPRAGHGERTLRSDDEIRHEKRRLRDELRARRAHIDSDESEAAGRAALTFLTHDDAWSAARRIGLFASTQGEPSTRSIFEAAVRAGRDVLFPRCLSAGEMAFAPASSWDELEVGRYGLLEPTCPIVHDVWRRGDLVLVPGLGFDDRGGRLGRGVGHYDRCFARRSGRVPWLIGFGFAFQLISEVPMEHHDRLLDGVLTEQGLVWRPDR